MKRYRSGLKARGGERFRVRAVGGRSETRRGFGEVVELPRLLLVFRLGDALLEALDLGCPGATHGPPT